MCRMIYLFEFCPGVINLHKNRHITLKRKVHAHVWSDKHCAGDAIVNVNCSWRACVSQGRRRSIVSTVVEWGGPPSPHSRHARMHVMHNKVHKTGEFLDNIDDWCWCAYELSAALFSLSAILSTIDLSHFCDRFILRMSLHKTILAAVNTIENHTHPIKSVKSNLVLLGLVLIKIKYIFLLLGFWWPTRESLQFPMDIFT